MSSGETSKFGIEPDDLGRFLDAISACDRVIPTGLMTLAAPLVMLEKARPELVLLRRLGESISDRLLDGVCQLSMGHEFRLRGSDRRGGDPCTSRQCNLRYTLAKEGGCALRDTL